MAKKVAIRAPVTHRLGDHRGYHLAEVLPKDHIVRWPRGSMEQGGRERHTRTHVMGSSKVYDLGFVH